MLFELIGYNLDPQTGIGKKADFSQIVNTDCLHLISKRIDYKTDSGGAVYDLWMGGNVHLFIDVNTLSRLKTIMGYKECY